MLESLKVPKAKLCPDAVQVYFVLGAQILGIMWSDVAQIASRNTSAFEHLDENRITWPDKFSTAKAS